MGYKTRRVQAIQQQNKDASTKATAPSPCLQAAAGPCLEEIPAQYRGFPQEYEELSVMSIRLWVQEDAMTQLC